MFRADVEDRIKVIKACEALSEDVIEGRVHRQAMEMISLYSGIGRSPELIDLTAKLIRFMETRIPASTNDHHWVTMNQYLKSKECQQYGEAATPRTHLSSPSSICEHTNILFKDESLRGPVYCSPSLLAVRLS